MPRTRNERGSGLIMLIGVTSALAILAVSLVTLTANAGFFTQTDRTRAKSFNVAEAGLDAGMAVIGPKWPIVRYGVIPSPLPSVDTTTFSNQFSTSEFARTTGKPFADVQFYDNSGPNNNTGPHYDANGDGQMYIDSQSTVNGTTSRVRALIASVPVTMGLPHGIALYAGGDLRSHGGGTTIDTEVLPQGSSSVTVWVGGSFTANGNNDFASNVNTLGPNVTPNPQPIPPASAIFSDALMAELLDAAQSQGRYYTDVSAATAALATGPLVYIKTTGDITITANGTFNGDGVSLPTSPAPPPGILIVDGGGVTFHGTPTYYGVVICRGGFIDVGNASIHGMVVSLDPTKGSDIGGSEQIVYNDNVVMNVNSVVPFSAKIVQDTWRQLPPR